jgi:hypothetical protein
MSSPSAAHDRRARQLAAWDALWRLLFADEPPAESMPAALSPPDPEHGSGPDGDRAAHDEGS